MLKDSFNSALSILSLGKFSNDDYRNYVEGFKRISEHIVGIRLNPNNAYLPAAKIMFLSACILKDIDPFALDIKQKDLIDNPPYNKINRLVKVQPEAFDIAATAIEIIKE